MRLFARKPSRALQDVFVKEANGAHNILGYALQRKSTNPPAGKENEAVDLTVQENRDAVCDELVRIIRDYGLEGCKESEIGGTRLVPLMMDLSKSPITDAAVGVAAAINAINFIARTYYEDYPQYQLLYEMVNNLAKTCCTGAAQTIGPDLPVEAVKTWPYFSRMFEETKRSNTLLWPDV